MSYEHHTDALARELRQSRREAADLRGEVRRLRDENAQLRRDVVRAEDGERSARRARIMPIFDMGDEESMQRLVRRFGGR